MFYICFVIILKLYFNHKILKNLNRKTVFNLQLLSVVLTDRFFTFSKTIVKVKVQVQLLQAYDILIKLHFSFYNKCQHLWLCLGLLDFI